MKNLKKLVALLLAPALILTLALIIPAFAAVGDTGYSDVDVGADYAPAVVWCREQGLMNGTGGDAFSPDATLTRAMVATVLYRAAGEPVVDGAPAFWDTPAGQWYSNAVVWADQTGIVYGYGDGRFGTNDPITREQLDVMIRRYQGEDPAWTSDPALNVPATRAEAAVAFYSSLRENGKSEAPVRGSKVLIAYFSATNNTANIANHLDAILDADLYRITPEQPYTSADLNYSDSSARAIVEQNDPNARPAISGGVDDMERYGAVFLGYPIWGGQAPRIISTFLESYDFSGKTIVPFCTSGSSPIGSSATNLHSLTGGATWLDGQRFSGSASRSAVETWVNGLNLTLGAPTGSITTNGGETIAMSALAHQDPNAKSVVYYASDISADGLTAVYEALNWTPGEHIAVKLSTGEPGSNYLRTDLIGPLVQSLTDPTIVECNTAYGGSRANTAMHYQVAADHGYTAIAAVDIMDENGSMTLPVTGGSNLTENYVGASFANYDSFLVLSHFKGHGMAGFGGAIKNISIGIASSRGKSHIHSGGAGGSMWGGNQDAFLESMAEAGTSVVEALNGQIVYINVMNRLSVDCDCDGHPSEPDMHDIAILASYDPVALDQACVDLVYAVQDGSSLIQRMESRNGIHTLEHAETVGLGSRSYQLVSMD